MAVHLADIFHLAVIPLIKALCSKKQKNKIKIV
jgi:hypothetical protein